jgi:LysR family transcriptional regulator, regulator for bpeEF and oprC
MDKLKSLTIFLRSAQLQSFSAAARQLGMSPSSVSRAVARLEEDLGIRLLQRTTRSLSLTEDGAMLYQRCQQVLDELEDIETSLKQSQSQPKGTLRLNFSIAIGKMYIVPKLAELAAQYPDLTFNVSFSDRLSDIIEEGIDATVRVGMGSDSRLVMQVLGTAYPVTCAAPSYLQRAGTPITLDDIARHRCINFILPQTGREIVWKFDRQGETIQLAVQSYLQFDYAEALLEAAIAGAGIIQAPKYIVARAIQQGRLQPILVDCNSKEGTIVAIVYPQKKYLSAKVRVFIDFMMKLAADWKRQGIID